MPDPYPYRGVGMLTKLDLEAMLRVLRAAKAGSPALAVAEWPREDQDASIALARFGYTTTTMPPGTGFRWSNMALTDAGAAYLAQVDP